MPWSKKQIGLFGADISRVKEGKKARTGMSLLELIRAMKEGKEGKKED